MSIPKIYTDETAARRQLQWPDDADVCRDHCGGADRDVAHQQGSGVALLRSVGTTSCV